MIHKPWKNVSHITLHNCFRKSGFKQTENDGPISQPPNHTNSILGWELLPDCGPLTFQEYVQVDDDIGVHGVLTDAELLDLPSQDDDGEENEEEEIEEPPPVPVTLSEARTALSTLRSYLYIHCKDNGHR